ncbi:hypothetical protein BDP55DRAFT_725589 [Colletotrichum godetiae]|uniref:Uncharacterized protein n=1 Tax=Colletotrichum godetiae TaxID=1209918 RepID=A0AAJ0AUV7_9PEZI|nr:uncharacterized protein BDP55DRAFT_725589 [Colletotrichum godetiae]KAK1689416.1 hypothetical protein BDP55DRAFT_725589 [Colletotrichum godetiae]
MQFSTITQLILLATAPLAMASVAAERTSSNSVFDVRMECIKSNCGGVGAGCAGAWCCVRYNKDGCKCIAPGDISENGDKCPAA